MEWVIHHLSEALVDRGHKVVVLAADNGDHWSDSPLLRELSPGYRLEHYPFGRRFGELLGRNRRAVLDALRRLKREFGFDVVHAHQTYYPGYCGVLGQRELDYPLVITDHGMFSQFIVDWAIPLSLGVRWQTLWTVRKAECLTAPGREAFDHLMARRHDPGLSRVLPNGIAVPPAGTIDELRGQETERQPRILLVGRNDPVKGYGTALRALAKMKADGARVTLSVVGKKTDELGPLANRLGVSDLFEPVSATTGDALWRRYAGASVFWLTSRREALGLTKLEAMCFGLPGVYNDAPGVREGVVDGENGLLFRENDAEDLAHKTATLIRDGALRARLGAAARTTGDRFRWPNIVPLYEDLYEELIARHRR